MSDPTSLDRLYLAGGTVAHLCSPNLYNRDIWVSRCGISDHRWTWRGTGSQDEYDRAKELRVCRKCKR